MTEVQSTRQGATQPSERCLADTAPSGGPTAARVPSGDRHRLPLPLGDTTVYLGCQQRVFLSVLKRYVGCAVSYQTLWHWLYDRRRFRRARSLAALCVLAQATRRRLPPNWRILALPYYGYILEKVTE